MTEEEIREQRASYYSISKYLESDFSAIDGLCFKAKFLLFKYMCINNNQSVYEFYEGLFDALLSLTPIEQIFNMAFWIYNVNVNLKQGIDMTLSMGTQETITYKNKTYIVDFLISGYTKVVCNDDGKMWEDGYDLKEPLIIECDGFDYHSNKKQMEYDYKRENDLKMAGYDIIRFTGSQIYNEPMECVEQVMNYIKRKAVKI